MSASNQDYKHAIELALAMASRNPALDPLVRAELFAVYLSGALKADIDLNLSDRLYALVEFPSIPHGTMPSILQLQAN